MSNYIGGIGRHRLMIRTAGSVVFDHTFPLCPARGFKPEFRADHYVHELIPLDISNPLRSREYFVNGFWGSWLLDWSEFPIDAEPGLKAIEFINKSVPDERQGTLEILFQPNIDDSRWFIVNNTFEPVSPAASKAADDAAGTLGIRLKLEVKQMLSEIPIGIASGYQIFTHVSNESIKIVI